MSILINFEGIWLVKSNLTNNILAKSPTFTCRISLLILLFYLPLSSQIILYGQMLPIDYYLAVVKFTKISNFEAEFTFVTKYSLRHNLGP